MPKTPLLRGLNQLFRDAHATRRSGVSLPGLVELKQERREREPLIARRSVVGALGAGALAAAFPRIASAKAQPKIVIVGGGIAGVTCALKLADRGLASTVYEASGRIGGRMFSNTTSWADGQVSEWCGELIDTGHVTIQALAKRFHLKLDDLHAAEPANSHDTYQFFGSYYKQSSADADFLHCVAERVANDANEADYPTRFDSFTEAGAELNAMSVYQWIESRVPGGHKSPLGQLLDVAYVTEYGADTRDQSALNLVYLLGYQPTTDRLDVFGASDETFHIRGGNGQLPVAIANSLSDVVVGHSLAKLAKTSGGRYSVTFNRNGGSSVEVTADFVVLALPFSVLRDIDTSKAGFDSLKKKAIRELGAGHNGKTHVQFSHRFWNQKGAWPGISNGSSYSDTGYQSSWDGTRAQKGNSGILVFYSGGATTDALTSTQGYATNKDANVIKDVKLTLQRAQKVFPGALTEYNGFATESVPHRSPLLKCSYAYFKVGQYLDFAGYEGAQQGGVLFCGEHTSQDFQGFMEGGASEGKRAARELAKQITGKYSPLDDL
ncbi:MAG: NAD(P)/FAD-dependent oxidoreductase [Myxococcales bacterium]